MCVARGQFVYILDGDMELDEGFLPLAVGKLNADPQLAGVAGLVQEMHVANLVFLRRQQSGDTVRPHHQPVCLNMGGLYRRSAVEPLGYLTNRNLHAFEEFELGIRLVAAGWRLERIAVASIRHYGHTDSTYALLWRRWRTRHACGHGELLREAWPQAHFLLALRHLRLYHVAALVLVSWACILGTALLAGPLPVIQLIVIIWGGMLALMTVRKRSVHAALYSVSAWHMSAAGLVCGLFRRHRLQPDAPVAHRVVQ